jgi:murein DD-endopeptidase MepM/ murein hydrolase activator NlpD
VWFEMKKQKTILIVPPNGVPVKAFRVKLWVIVLVIVFVVLGFAGYFIPFNNFTLNKVEQNQKQNLTEQNKALLQNIVSTLRLLNNLKEQVTKLEEKRQSVLRFGIIGSEASEKKKKIIRFEELSTRELLTYITNQEKNIENFTSKVSENDNLFDRIPVVKPVPESSSISRQFGQTQDPFTGKTKYHYGNDYIGEKGAPIIATASGVVERTENHPIWGKRIFIDHGNGYETIYAHVGDVKATGGQHVKKGDIVGFIGLTGLTSGPHVHYEVVINGSTVNPSEYLFPLGLF